MDRRKENEGPRYRQTVGQAWRGDETSTTLNLDQLQVGIELHSGMLHPSKYRPLVDAGATFGMVRESRVGKSLYPDDAGAYSLHLAKHLPTFLWGTPEWWKWSMSSQHAGMIVPEWPYTDAAYYLANLNHPDPHVSQAISDDNRSVADMRQNVSGGMIGRSVSSAESVAEIGRLETDFLVIASADGSCYSVPRSQLMESVLALTDLPAMVYGIKSGELASAAMRHGAAGVIVPATSLSVEVISEITDSLSGFT